MTTLLSEIMFHSLLFKLEVRVIKMSLEN